MFYFCFFRAFNLFFTSNSAVFIGGAAKIFFSSGHPGTLATPLDYIVYLIRKKQNYPDSNHWSVQHWDNVMNLSVRRYNTMLAQHNFARWLTLDQH